MTTDFEYATGGKTQTAAKKESDENHLRDVRRSERRRRRWLILHKGSKLLLPLFLLALFLFLFRSRIFYSVGSGEVILVYFRFLGGTSHNQIGHEGLHIVTPWDEAYIYKIRIQSVVVPMTVLAKNGVEVRLDAQMRFHAVPEMVPYLHREYGPDYVKDLITPQLIESVQDVIGSFDPEQLYASERGASSGQIFRKAKRTIGGVFIGVDDIALFNIRLPEKVQQSIQAKAEAEQNALAYAFRVDQEQQEFRRKQLDAKGLLEYQKLVIPPSVLVWKGIEATLELAKSPNSKVIVMGSKDNLPLMLGNVPDLTTVK